MSLAQSVVVGTRNSSGEIAFRVLEDFQINQKKKVRLLPDAKGTVDENALKRLTKVDLGQVPGVIRNDAKDRLVQREAPPSKAVNIVLPEDYTLKTPTNVDEIPGRLSLLMLESKKQKQSDMLPPEQFFVYLSGSSPERATLDFVQKDWVFNDLGEQLRSMEAFVTAFRMTPEAEEFRGVLQTKLQNGLAAFEDGGPWEDLLTLRRFSELGRKAYPNDAPLRQLHERVTGRIAFVESRLRVLRSAALSADWDMFLNQYGEFERYQSSFKDIVAMRQEALEETARTHAVRARAFASREDHEAALKEASGAELRDPANKEIIKLVDDEKLLVSQRYAKEAASHRKKLDLNSPEGRRFQQALSFAGNFIRDKDYAKAQESLTEAQRLNPEAPEILLSRAKLLVSEDRLSEALPILDSYDRLVVEPEELKAGADTRFQIQYEIGKRREAGQKQIEQLIKAGEYSQLDALMKTALKSDSEALDFLYYGGIAAAAVRDSARARQLLTSYLDHSNSLEGDLSKRDRALRVRNAIVDLKPQPASGPVSWMTGRKLADGVVYDPESLAFQIPFDSVTGSKVHMTFSWDQGRLDSIKTTFDDEKAARVYKQLGADAETGAGSSEEGNFFFQYSPAGQLLSARTRPLAKDEQKPFRVHFARDKKPPSLVDADGAPVLVLRNSPYVDASVMNLLEGPVATTVAGNSFFHPFLWDGIHYFSVQYDAQGRIATAQEWNVDNRLWFTWDGDRLTAIRAYRANSSTPYYERKITYAGGQLSAEDYTLNGKAGKVRYTFSGRTLQSIKVDHDGKEWVVHPKS
jgi:tetratricopeptide (TPR) repeat protein